MAFVVEYKPPDKLTPFGTFTLAFEKTTSLPK
jgi:hypothetical protein